MADTPKDVAEAIEKRHARPSDAATGSEAVARALALEYYRGQYRERYDNQAVLKMYAGPAADNPRTAQLWIEEQARDMARRFWSHWHAESIEILNSDSTI
jgi:Leu/Phe-tRNA-protein transferase